MVPKLHKKGTSFRGAAAYVLHDKGRAMTANRVSWAETHNLATRNPQTAWRIMAATAMDQPRLKASAGIKNTGRKSNEHVLHFTLSWHQDEAAGLTRDEMLRAARGAIAALKGDDRQALIVAHNDEPQPHVHVLLNRVSPTDGRSLSSSKEKLALSRWAEQYERERGRVLCPERVVNNAARKRGTFVRGRPNRPRHIFEREAVNDNRPTAVRLRAEQRQKDRAISRKQRLNAARHKEARQKFTADHRSLLATIRLDAKREIAVARQQVHEQFKPSLLAQQRRQELEIKQFNDREQSFLGRMTNRLKSLSLKSMVKGEKRQATLSEGFRTLSSAGARLEQLKRRHLREQRKALSQQRAAESVQVRRIRLDEKEKRSKANELFKTNRAELMLNYQMEAAAVRAAWKHRRNERGQTWDTFERENPAQKSTDLVRPTKESERVFRGRGRAPQVERPGATRESDDGRRER
jgi:hypothetical protein